METIIIIALGALVVVLLIAYFLEKRKPKCHCKGGCHCHHNNDCGDCSGCIGRCENENVIAKVGAIVIIIIIVAIVAVA